MPMIVIPDIHGRAFWRRAAMETAGKEHIVFLGDYLDPYPSEGIDYEEAREGLLDILRLKVRYPEGVTLLLGNHDLHYLDYDIAGSRYDAVHRREIQRILEDNFDLFHMAFEETIDGKRYLLSHAGILGGWLSEHAPLFSAVPPGELVDFLNRIWWTPDARRPFLKALADVPSERGGTSPCGSMVWADLREHSLEREEVPGCYQVFGHTQVKEPVITPFYACLDCRMVFRISEDGITAI